VSSVTTAQVRFTRLDGGEACPLAEVPALVFSEVMRAVDLFVSVCTIGNDPPWVGGERPYSAASWQGYVSGELSAAAQTRRAVLECPCPASRSPPVARSQTSSLSSVATGGPTRSTWEAGTS
jgi:hypothetical protein